MVPCNPGCAQQTWTGDRVQDTWTTCGNYNGRNPDTGAYGWYVTSRPGPNSAVLGPNSAVLAALSWNVRGYT